VTRIVRVLRRAQRDLQEIYDYMAREAPIRATAFLDSLLDAVESLGQSPGRGAVPRDEVLRARGYRYLVHREYLIFYKLLGKQQVRVYRVLHGKRAFRDLL
jgi:toxin ParE1/3/4